MPNEILLTLALHTGMHVIDKDAPATGEHVVTAEPRRCGAGEYALGLDGRPVVAGARHGWLVTT
jgi:hypothetical protein